MLLKIYFAQYFKKHFKIRSKIFNVFETKCSLCTLGFQREELRLLLTETSAPKWQPKPCSGSHGCSKSPTKEVRSVIGSHVQLEMAWWEPDEKLLFVSMQGKCSLTPRTPPACWGCAAGPWCFSLSLSSERRPTLSKNFHIKTHNSRKCSNNSDLTFI